MVILTQTHNFHPPSSPFIRQSICWYIHRPFVRPYENIWSICFLFYFLSNYLSIYLFYLIVLVQNPPKKFQLSKTSNFHRGCNLRNKMKIFFLFPDRIPPDPKPPPILSPRGPVVDQSELRRSPAQHDSDQWDAPSAPGWAVLPVLPGEPCLSIQRMCAYRKSILTDCLSEINTLINSNKQSLTCFERKNKRYRYSYHHELETLRNTIKEESSWNRFF